MNVNIWSDVRCPFCYIGKRKFENALKEFPYKDNLTITWHSFELDPNLKTDPELNPLEYLAKVKGIPEEKVKEMMQASTEMAKGVGIEMNIEKTVVANSFNAHRLIQFAKSQGLGNEIEEALFKAYFVEGKNIDDKPTLRNIGISIGLKKVDLVRVLFTDAYSEEVRAEEVSARRIGVNAVPFFVFDNKYAISGAQPTEVFLETLNKSWEEFKQIDNSLIVNEGNSCTADGDCA